MGSDALVMRLWAVLMCSSIQGNDRPWFLSFLRELLEAEKLTSIEKKICRCKTDVDGNMDVDSWEVFKPYTPLSREKGHVRAIDEGA